VVFEKDSFFWQKANFECFVVDKITQNRYSFSNAKIKSIGFIERSCA
jgi:hypothetical protein